MVYSLLGLAERMGAVAIELEHHLSELVERTCEIFEHDIKTKIGTYDNGWPQLAQSTMDDRTRRGYPADEPLLVTSELRDSVQHNSDRWEGYVGSDNEKMVWHEWGTQTIPARSMLGSAIVNCEHEINETIGTHIRATLK